MATTGNGGGDNWNGGGRPNMITQKERMFALVHGKWVVKLGRERRH